MVTASSNISGHALKVNDRKTKRSGVLFVAENFPEKGCLPVDIPAGPSNTYAEKGWLSWGDWLGTGTLARR